jgi:hypothetical protein
MRVAVRYLATIGTLIGLSAACTDAPEPLPEVEERTLGTEIYLVFCGHVAGSYFPNDVRGTVNRQVCKRNQQAPVEAPRLEALRRNRPRLVSALDAILADDAFADDELTGFVKDLIPLFDLPLEPMPRATKAMAELMDAFRADPEALAALERISHRQGYRPLQQALGTLAAVFKYPRLQPFLLAFTQSVQKDGVAYEAFQQLLTAVGMELAVYEPVPRGEEGSLDVARELLMAEDDAFASAAPSWLVRRDARGFAGVNLKAPMGFADSDDDGLPDVDRLGRFVDAALDVLETPTPFTVLAEVEKRSQATRDAAGRALAADGSMVFDYFDVDRTLLSGLSAEVKTWSTPNEEGDSTLLGFMRGVPLVLGADKTLEASFGAGKLSYAAHDLTAAPLMGVIDFASLFIEAPELDETLSLFERVLTEHEDVAARFAKALLAAKARADQDTTAHIAHPSNFWDETLQLLRRLAIRRGPTSAPPDGSQVAAADETALEALMRAFADPKLKHMGSQLAVMGRFNNSCTDPVTKSVAPCIDINGRDINAPVVGAYRDRVDRTQPDLPADLANHVAGNTSQMENFLLLVGELMDRPLCNKKTTGTKLFRSMASDNCDDYNLKGLIGGSAGVLGLALGDIEECGFIEVPDMGRAFGQAMTGELDLLAYINNDLIAGLLNLIGGPDALRGTFDDIFRACSGVAEFDTTPTGPALARVLFAPPGTQTQIFGDEMFPPATVKPWVAGSSRPFDVNDPPSQYKLADVFQGSLPAWEIAWQFGDDAPISLQQSMGPMMAALNKHDFFPFKNAEKRTWGAPYYDSEQYLFNPFAGVFASYYPSPESRYQSDDPRKPFFSHRANLVSYEDILVDMIAEPDIKPNAYLTQEQADWWNGQTNIGFFAAMNELMQTLDAMDFASGRDGIDVLADLSARLLNPHAFCAPEAATYVNADGKGACDCDRDGDGAVDSGAPALCRGLALRPPLKLRGSGRDHWVWELGDAFDGEDRKFEPLSPIDILLSALSDFDAVFDAKQNEAEKATWRAARSHMIDTLFAVAEGADGTARFANPHTVPMLRAMTDWGRRRVGIQRDAGEEVSVRAWSATLPSRFQSFAESPVVASLLNFMAAAQQSPELKRELSSFMAHTFDAGQEPFRAMILVLADALQLLRDGDNVSPVLRATSKALVPNVADVLGAGQAPAPLEGAPADLILDFVNAAVVADESFTMAKLMGRMVALDGRHEQGQVAPLETLIDVIAEVNRAQGPEGSPLVAVDISAMLGEISDFLKDEQRGMARMVQIIQNRFVDGPVVGATQDPED